MDLAELSTLHVGGPADRLLEPATREELLAAARSAWAADDDVLVIGGGSNLVVADAGFPGTVLHVLSRGIERSAQPVDRMRLAVQAGESWDGLVATAVAEGLSGIEALSGIPGSCGAAPIQNIGAYGQELSSSLVSIEFADRATGEVEIIPAFELGFGYRSSALKHGRDGLVLSITLELGADGSGLSAPVAYPQLASALGVELGARVPLADVRSAVLALRRSKGMLLDPADPDSVSVGSFFTNPIVSERFARGLPGDVPRWPLEGDDETPIVLPLDSSIPIPPHTAGERATKLSAAWLIEHAGIGKGFRLPGSRAAVSSKHTLAIVNTGGATATQIGELARYIQTMVLSQYGVILQPEPTLVGIEV
ncbi:UDP-N-acetylmuramate dehydrogenase [soil metagenome]